METICAAGEENEGVGVVEEGKAPVIVLGSSRPIRKIRQPLRDVQELTNADSCCGGETNQVVKKVAPPRKRAPAKRKSRSTKGRNSKRAKKIVETPAAEVITPEEIVKDEENLAPVLVKMETLEPQTDQEKDKLAGDNQEFTEARSEEPPILEKMIKTEAPVQIQSPIRQVIKPISPPRTPRLVISSPKLIKKKKAKGRNGNIYIGVANRIIWLELQELFGFDNINNFGNFVMSYMRKVHEDFTILHEVAVDIGIFQAQGLTGFKWVNGLPHPVNSYDEFVQLPEVQLSDEYYKRAFEVTYDLCLKRGKFLVDLASGNHGAEEELDDEELEELAGETPRTAEDAPTKVEPQQAQDIKAGIIELPAATSATFEVAETKDVKKVEESEIAKALEPATNLEIGTEEDKKDLETATTLDTKVEKKDVDVESKTLVEKEAEKSIPPETMKTPIPSIDDRPLMFEMEEAGEALVPLGPPIDLQLNMESDDCVDDNKENIQPPCTPNNQAQAVIAQVDAKKNALRQILGDISLESICSPDNFASFNTPNNSMSK